MSNARNELARLHTDLAELYKGKSTDTLQIARLWLRINALEDEVAAEGEE